MMPGWIRITLSIGFDQRARFLMISVPLYRLPYR